MSDWAMSWSQQKLPCKAVLSALQMGWSIRFTKGMFASVNITFVFHKKPWTGLFQSPVITWKLLFVYVHPCTCVCIGRHCLYGNHQHFLDCRTGLWYKINLSCGLFICFYSYRGYLWWAHFDLHRTYLKFSHILFLIVSSWDIIAIWASQRRCYFLQ